VVRRQAQPRGEVLSAWPLAHLEADFGQNIPRQHDVDAVNPSQLDPSQLRESRAPINPRGIVPSSPGVGGGPKEIHGKIELRLQGCILSVGLSITGLVLLSIEVVRGERLLESKQRFRPIVAGQDLGDVGLATK
jgi:hypothetical protein